MQFIVLIFYLRLFLNLVPLIKKNKWRGGDPIPLEHTFLTAISNQTAGMCDHLVFIL